MLKLMGKKIFTVLCLKNCLSKPVDLGPDCLQRLSVEDTGKMSSK